MRLCSLFVPLLLLVGCGSSSQGGGQSTLPPRSTTYPDASVARGVARMQQGECAIALREDFGPLAEEGDRHYASQGVAVRASRIPGPAGDLAALLPSAASGSGTTVAVPTDYPDTIYFAAYCAVEIGDLALAERYLLRALEIIHDDPGYLSELGHIKQTQRDFLAALDAFTRAEASVSSLEGVVRQGQPPIEIIGHDLAWWHRRTLRGMGFSLIELGRLDDAEAVYHRVLAIDPADEQAATELQLIQELRTRGNASTL